MGKKAEDAATQEAPSATEVKGLKNKVALMEEAMQKQSLEFRSELASSQAKMQSDIKDQLDDFLITFMKMQSNSPPPNKPLESVASNLGHTNELQLMLSEKAPPSHPYSYSVSPHSSAQPTRPVITQLSKFPPYTASNTSPIPQLGMPTSLWNPNSNIQTLNQSLSFPQQLPNILNPNMWPIPHISISNQTIPHNPYQAHTTYTQPNTYIPTTYPYYQNTPATNQPQ
jgi:hypothetical protein